MPDDPERLLRTRRDRPAFHWKWLRDMENTWDNPYRPSGILPKCQYFTDDYRRCADGISWERAKTECRFELEDMLECHSSSKLLARQDVILKQRKKLIKEGKYTPPPFPQSLPSFADSAQ